MNNPDVLILMNAFINIHKAKIVSSSIIKKDFFGNIIWEDDKENEHQEIVWHIKNDICNDSRVIELINYIKKNDLVSGDRIILSSEELKQKMIHDGWKSTNVGNAISKLCQINVIMLDNGEETDSLYFHF